MMATVTIQITQNWTDTVKQIMKLNLLLKKKGFVGCNPVQMTNP